MMMTHAFMIGALAAGLVLAGPAIAEDVVELASDNCFEVGQAVAARDGATFVSAEAARQNGVEGCRVVLLYDAHGNERPRREEIFVAR